MVVIKGVSLRQAQLMPLGMVGDTGYQGAAWTGYTGYLIEIVVRVGQLPFRVALPLVWRKGDGFKVVIVVIFEMEGTEPAECLVFAQICRLASS